MFDVVSTELIQCSQSKAPISSALIYRDSFGEALIPWFSKYFKRSSYIWSYELDFDRILKEKPKVVIQLFVQRRLVTNHPYSKNEDGNNGSK